jgi:hypothetical protein
MWRPNRAVVLVYVVIAHLVVSQINIGTMRCHPVGLVQDSMPHRRITGGPRARSPHLEGVHTAVMVLNDMDVWVFYPYRQEETCTTDHYSALQINSTSTPRSVRSATGRTCQVETVAPKGRGQVHLVDTRPGDTTQSVATMDLCHWPFIPLTHLWQTHTKTQGPQNSAIENTRHTGATLG